MHEWLTEPDFDQEAVVKQAEAALAAHAGRVTPLLAAAACFQAWIEAGGARAPMRAALLRHWTKRGLLRVPVPLTGAGGLRADVDWDPGRWVPTFLLALAEEADDALPLLFDLERSWLAARGAVAGRRRGSRAAAAIDLLAHREWLSGDSVSSRLHDLRG